MAISKPSMPRGKLRQKLPARHPRKMPIGGPTVEQKAASQTAPPMYALTVDPQKINGEPRAMGMRINHEGESRIFFKRKSENKTPAIAATAQQVSIATPTIRGSSAFI
jgi:hypothetical protein